MSDAGRGATRVTSRSGVCFSHIETSARPRQRKCLGTCRCCREGILAFETRGGGGGGCLPRSPGHSYTLLTRNTTSTFKVRCHRHIPPAVFPRPVRARTVACRSPLVRCRIFFERFERQLCHTAVYQTAAFCGRPLHSSSPRFRGDSHVLFERVSRRAARGRATFPARAALETQGRAASSTAREGWHRFRICLRGTSR